MIRCLVAIVMGLAIILGASSAWSAAAGSRNVDNFLEHRNVLLSVEFSPASLKLSDESKRALDRIVSDIKALLKDHMIVRIEGYASPQGKEDNNLVLSMQRAMAVQDYLRERYGLEIDLFFNGSGSRAPSEAMVQLAFYKDTLGLTKAEVDTIITHQ